MGNAKKVRISHLEYTLLLRIYSGQKSSSGENRYSINKLIESNLLKLSKKKDLYVSRLAEKVLFADEGAEKIENRMHLKNALLTTNSHKVVINKEVKYYVLVDRWDASTKEFERVHVEVCCADFFENWTILCSIIPTFYGNPFNVIFL